MKKCILHLISYCQNSKCFKGVGYNLEVRDNRKNNYPDGDMMLQKLLQQNLGKKDVPVNEIHLQLNLLLEEKEEFQSCETFQECKQKI
jgi:hypothetical protein